MKDWQGLLFMYTSQVQDLIGCSFCLGNLLESPGGKMSVATKENTGSINASVSGEELENEMDKTFALSDNNNNTDVNNKCSLISKSWW